MSQKLLKLLLSELGRVRIVCRKCGSVSEIDVDNLGNVGQFYCPGCPSSGKTVIEGNQLGALAHALRKLRELKDIEVEFVVPEKE